MKKLALLILLQALVMSAACEDGVSTPSENELVETDGTDAYAERDSIIFPDTDPMTTATDIWDETQSDPYTEISDRYDEQESVDTETEQTENCHDLDGDGYRGHGPDCDRSDQDYDCDEQNDQIYPDAPEACDGIDNNCDQVVDEGCPCEPGDTRPCGSEENYCIPGTQYCVAGHWHEECRGGRLRAEEICDGIDNDCDDQIDEGFNLGEECVSGLGVCQRHGVYACDQSGGSVCDAAPGTPQPERCDGIDNDCDGNIDNGFHVGEACWKEENDCRAEGTFVCLDDGSGSVCDAEVPEPSIEICDGIDNNCNGLIDEVFILGQDCTAGLGECMAHGETVCSDRGTTTCDAVAGTPSDEVCDGLDNDCDGNIDENLSGCCQIEQEQRDCGTDTGVCTAGNQTCLSGQWTECLDGDGDPIVRPSDEVCDGLDNDCDGLADEDYPALGYGCEAGVGRCRTVGTYICSEDGLAFECDAEPGRPQNEECNGRDDDCDGQVDEDFDLLNNDEMCGDCHTVCQYGFSCVIGYCVSEGMVPIPAGTYWFGCDHDFYECGNTDHIHQSTTQDFRIDRYEVTVAHYDQCVSDNDCAPPGMDDGCNWMIPGRQNHPVNCVTEQDAFDFCHWRGKYVCGPSSFQIAARGVDQRPFPWGWEVPTCETTNFNSCRGQTAAVGSYPEDVSTFGIYDLGGNVCEWTGAGFCVGGTYSSAPDQVYVWQRSGEQAGPETGFRCCDY